MALTRGIGSRHFAGSGNVFGDGSDSLGAVVRELLRIEARRTLQVDATANLTNSGGGGRTVTFTNATEVVNLTAHALSVNDAVTFTNSGGALPTGLSANTIYYVRAVLTSGTFTLTTTPGGALKTISTDGTGTNAVFAYDPSAAPANSDLTALTTGCTAASVLASFVTVDDAHTELATQANTLLALLGGGSVGAGGGVAVDGTIAAIDVDVAVNTGATDSVSYTTWLSRYNETRQNTERLLGAVNALRAAVGLPIIAHKQSTVPNINVGSNLNATFTTLANGATLAATVTEVAVELVFASMRETVTVMHAAIAEVNGIALSTSMTVLRGA